MPALNPLPYKLGYSISHRLASERPAQHPPWSQGTISPKDEDFVCSLMNPQCLDQGLACRRYTVNVCWMNKWEPCGDSENSHLPKCPGEVATPLGTHLWPLGGFTLRHTLAVSVALSWGLQTQFLGDSFQPQQKWLKWQCLSLYRGNQISESLQKEDHDRHKTSRCFHETKIWKPSKPCIDI